MGTHCFFGDEDHVASVEVVGGVVVARELVDKLSGSVVGAESVEETEKMLGDGGT